MVSRLTGPTGSSPRMRGALAQRIQIMIEDGIIPADAGSTRITAWKCFAWQDHPRGCGEHHVE